MTRPPRRVLTLVVLVTAVAAVLALAASGRVWARVLVERPAPLPPVHRSHTGGGMLPWLPGTAWVALAAAGALLATRGLARTAVGCVLAVCGCAVAVAGVLAVADPGGLLRAGERGGAGGHVERGWPAVAWPVLVVLAGLALGAAGVATLRWGRRWPAMGARYERRRAAVPPSPRSGGESRAGEESVEVSRPESGALWDALDRGEDPTA